MFCRKICHIGRAQLWWQFVGIFDTFQKMENLYVFNGSYLFQMVIHRRRASVYKSRLSANQKLKFADLHHKFCEHNLKKPNEFFIIQFIISFASLAGIRSRAKRTFYGQPSYARGLSLVRLETRPRASCSPLSGSRWTRPRTGPARWAAVRALAWFGFESLDDLVSQKLSTSLLISARFRLYRYRFLQPNMMHFATYSRPDRLNELLHDSLH